ncbi:hypothetical protein M758_11G070800 [Ceratodon purpureus]|nr:hypothetical protein M758_11G070800 [Ceratodon purpureus]
MRIHCDACEKNLATVICCADEAALCGDCDVRIHAANKLSDKHVRVSLLTAPEPAKCDICQEKRGFFFCLEDRALLCRDCDVSIHTVNTLSCNHKRFLVTGTRVALEELKDDSVETPVASEFCSSMPSPACSTMSSQSSHCSRASALSSPTSTLQGPRNFSSQTSNLKAAAPAAPAAAASVYRAPAVSSFNPSLCPPPAFSGNVHGVPEMKLNGQQQFAVPQLMSPPSMGQQAGVATQASNGMRKSSISEFLTDAVPGWRVDELLNFADCADGFNSTDFASSKVDGVTAVGGDYDWTADLSLFEEQMFAMHEVPQFPPPAPQLAAPPRCVRAPRHVRNRANRNQDVYDIPNNFNDGFIVPVIRNPSAPVSQSLPKRMKRDLYHMSNH